MKDNIEYYFQKCRDISFPLPEYTAEEITKQLNNLRCCHSKVNNAGLKAIYTYHPSLWIANKQGKKSPYDGWYDDRLLIKVIENRLKYRGQDLTADDILRGFTISGVAPKVSLFRPSLAKYLIEKYLDDFNTIFDPCSGYSGRLLGAWAADKYYIGQDINPITVDESNKLIKELTINNCAATCVNSLATTGEYPCLFTCPPYGEKENWGQSIEPLTADEWIDTCLKNYKCSVYLFVVDETIRYNEHIVETISNKSYLSKNEEKIVLIRR